MSEGELTPLPEAAIGVSFQIPLENAQPGVQIRMLALQTHLPLSTPEVELNDALDLMHRVGDRQFRVREVEMLEEEKRIRLLQREQVQKSYNDKLSAAQDRWAQANNRGSFKQVGKEKADFENMQREMDRMDVLIDELDKRVERTVRKVYASSSAADRS